MITQRHIRYLLAAMAAGAVTVGILQGPTAHADPDTYIHDVHSIGIYGPPGDLYTIGYAICGSFDNGANGVDVAEYIYLNTNETISVDDAVALVIVATEDLCPRHDHRGTAA